MQEPRLSLQNDKSRGLQFVSSTVTLAGVILLVIALAFAVFNISTRRDAAQDASLVAARIEQQLPYERTTFEGLTSEAMPTLQIDGNSYIGLIEFPDLEIELPVLSEYSEDLAGTAPGRTEGSIYNGTLVIVGGNYNTHFGRLSELKDGDEVLFTDCLGREFKLTVSTAEVFAIDDAEVEVHRSGHWDLTLLTPQFSGNDYLAIRCSSSS